VANKYAMSRRDADLFIDNGWVKVNGNIASKKQYAMSIMIPDPLAPVNSLEEVSEGSIDKATNVEEDPTAIFDPDVELLPQAEEFQQRNRATTVILNKPLGIISGLFGNQHNQNNSTSQYKPAIQLLTKENMYVPRYRPRLTKKQKLLQQDKLQQYQKQQRQQQQPSETETEHGIETEQDSIEERDPLEDESSQLQSPTLPPIEPYQLSKLAVAGRLDINTTGLLLFTQDGSIASHIIGSNSTVEKEYLVRLSAPNNTQYDYDYTKYYISNPTTAMEELQDKVQLLRNGIMCCGELLEAKSIDILHTTDMMATTQYLQNQIQLRIILTQGKKHHIRRMIEGVNYHVQALKRVRIGNITLGSLPVGMWRYKYQHERI
jgi:pseudouridine synthase